MRPPKPSDMARHDGREQTWQDWANELDLTVQTLISRRKRGWSVKKTLTTPSTRTPHNKGQRYAAEPLTPDEVQRLIDACSQRAPTGIRNRALLALLYRTGLRIAEALALKPADVDADARTVRVLEGKGRRARTTGIDPTALAYVSAWLERRATRGLNGRQMLFCTLDGGPVSDSYIRQLLPRLGRRAEIEKRVHAHGLRHTHAAELAAENVPVNVISQTLGHSNSGTTARYIDHIAPTAALDAVRNRDWSQ